MTRRSAAVVSLVTEHLGGRVKQSVGHVCVCLSACPDDNLEENDLGRTYLATWWFIFNLHYIAVVQRLTYRSKYKVTEGKYIFLAKNKSKVK